MAEALLRHYAPDSFDAHRAGLDPKPIHFLTHKVMAEIGIDTSKQNPKSVSTYLGKAAVRAAIMVCENAKNSCPTMFPFAGSTLY